MAEAAVATTVGTSKQQVLEAAHRLITQNGYAGLSMRELARESGLAKATIYHHFHDKQDVYVNVLEQDMLSMARELDRALKIQGDWTTRLRNLIQTYLRLQSERRFLLMTALRERAGDEECLFDLIKKHRHEVLRPLREIIQAGLDENLLRDVDVDMAVVSLFGLMNGFITFRVFIEEGEISEDEVEHTLQLFLHGIVAN